MVGVNQTDEDKRSDHGEHRHSQTAAKKTDSCPHGSPANRAHNQRIRLSDDGPSLLKRRSMLGEEARLSQKTKFQGAILVLIGNDHC